MLAEASAAPVITRCRASSQSASPRAAPSRRLDARTMAARAALCRAPPAHERAFVVRAHAGCGKDERPLRRRRVEAADCAAPLAHRPRPRAMTASVAAAARPERVEAFLDGLKIRRQGPWWRSLRTWTSLAIPMQGFADRQRRADHHAEKGDVLLALAPAAVDRARRAACFISVKSVHIDCDKDSLIYMGVPDGPPATPSVRTPATTRATDGPGERRRLAAAGLRAALT